MQASSIRSVLFNTTSCRRLLLLLLLFVCWGASGEMLEGLLLRDRGILRWNFLCRSLNASPFTRTGPRRRQGLGISHGESFRLHEDQMKSHSIAMLRGPACEGGARFYAFIPAQALKQRPEGATAAVTLVCCLLGNNSEVQTTFNTNCLTEET